MGDPVTVTVIAFDPLLDAGATSTLRGCPDLAVVEPDEDAAVCVVIVDKMNNQVLDAVRAARHAIHRPGVVLVASDLKPVEVLDAIGAGARGVLRRREADEARLLRTVCAVAAGDCAVPPDILDRLVRHAEGARTAAAAYADRTGPGLNGRERAVLALLADGCKTEEIARELSYSIRTVTGVIHDVTHRFRLRNRAHAVAYVLRTGLL
jgi:DNA-binding NarL/FixJ family response regulator